MAAPRDCAAIAAGPEIAVSGTGGGAVKISRSPGIRGLGAGGGTGSSVLGLAPSKGSAPRMILDSPEAKACGGSNMERTTIKAMDFFMPLG